MYVFVSVCPQGTLAVCAIILWEWRTVIGEGCGMVDLCSAEVEMGIGWHTFHNMKSVFSKVVLFES